jgi:hypothetical protein
MTSRGGRARRGGFAFVTAAERRQADLFFADLLGISSRLFGHASSDAIEDRGRPGSIDLSTTENVMWEVVRILNRQQDANSADPDRSTTTASWYVDHKDLFRQWHRIVYGELVGSTRTRPAGGALAAKIEAALGDTQPFLHRLEAHGGKSWTQTLARFVYRPIADLEYEAVSTKPEPAPSMPIAPLVFTKRPTQVSLDEFFSHVTVWENRPIDINMGVGRYSVGSFTTGDVFTVSQQDERTLLWSNSLHVLFMRGGAIFAQDGQAFSEDVILGAFVLAAQNAAGSAFIAQLMVETALSFTPWGVLADGVAALKAMTEGDWKGAALTFLPGASIGLATKTRGARAAARSLAEAGRITAQVIEGTVHSMGRGGYRLGGNLRRGVWVIGERAGKKTFQFFDDVGKRWIDDIADAHLYIKCSTCQFTRRGLDNALDAAVDEVMEDLARAPAYSSRGRALIPRRIVKDVVEAYGPFGDRVVEWITDAWPPTGNAAMLAEDTLRVAKSLSVIKDALGYQQAIEIFEDLASSSDAVGTLFELRWAALHAADIKELAIPVARRNGWFGKGLDVLKKTGEAIELKNFNFTSAFYKASPGLTVERIMKQVRSRLHYPDVTRAMVIFNSDAGIMPKALRHQLTAAMKELSRTSGKPCTFGFWSPGTSAGLAP